MSSRRQAEKEWYYLVIQGVVEWEFHGGTNHTQMRRARDLFKKLKSEVDLEG